MSRRRRVPSLVRLALLLIAAMTVLALPAAGGEKREGPPSKLLEQLSGAVASAYIAANPDVSPFGRPLAAVKKAKGKGAEGKAQKFCQSRSRNDVFNCDEFGLPQNEESITACTGNTDYVLGG